MTVNLGRRWKFLLLKAMCRATCSKQPIQGQDKMTVLSTGDHFIQMYLKYMVDFVNLILWLVKKG